MRGVEYHGTTGLAHDREGAHVRNQVVVAERGAAFAHEDVVFSARLARLFHHVLHFGRRQELALLDVDRSSRCGDDVYEIGLAAEKRRGLQHVDGRRYFRDVVLVVDVGQHRHADLLLHLCEDLQPLVHPEAAVRLSGAAVGLVVGRFVDERHIELFADLLQRGRSIERHLARFDHARTGDEEQGLVEADFEAAKLHALKPRSRSWSCWPGTAERPRRTP